ncbi:phage minor tail protein L [Citrobacter freundii]|nr:phage minor tail protein L [Citrobacter freundii]
MQQIPPDTMNETTKTEQSARNDLWEIDRAAIGVQRYYFSNEANKKGKPVTWLGRKYAIYPIQVSGLAPGRKGSSARPTLVKLSGLAEDVCRLNRATGGARRQGSDIIFI